ncbi:hypothetical protein BGZ73_002774 [Actinomortierella ambigua]|nr:hypothetical protein BGZ73_002774 [Actinomortierella ambigua]
MSSRNTAIAVFSFIALFLFFTLSSRSRTSIDTPHGTQPTSHTLPTPTIDDSDEQLEARLESECTQLWRNALPSQHEMALQKADFERELARQIAHLRTLPIAVELNDSPSTLERDLARRLWKRYHPTTAYPSKSISFFNSKPFFTLSSSSSVAAVTYRYRVKECEAWRETVRQRGQKVDQDTFAMLGGSGSTSSSAPRSRYRSSSPSSSSSSSSSSTSSGGGLILPSASSPISLENDPIAAHALARFVQSHPNRERIQPNSIMAHTIAALAHKSFTDPSGFTVELDPVKILAGSRRAATFNNDDIHVLVLDSQVDPEVTVMVGNPIDEVVKLRQAGYRPALLNVANDQVPGGDYYLDSTNDREADLFRRTTVHQCLDQEPRRSQFYPLKENGGVYCPNQAVIRLGAASNYDFMDRFEWISVLSVPRIPKLETREREDGMGVQFLEGEDDKVRRKLLSAMKIGVSMGHDALVLPAHGTDQNQNPPDIIAAVYRSIIGRDFMGGNKRFQTYKKIVMVLDPEYAYRIVNETSAYRMPPPAPSPSPVSSESLEREDEADENEEDNAIATLLPLWEDAKETDDEGDKKSWLHARADDDDDDNEDQEAAAEEDAEDKEDEEEDTQDVHDGFASSAQSSSESDDFFDLSMDDEDGKEDDGDDDEDGDEDYQDDFANGELTVPEGADVDYSDGEEDESAQLPDLEDEDERSEIEELREEQVTHPDYTDIDPEEEVEEEDEALIRNLRLTKEEVEEIEDMKLAEDDHELSDDVVTDPVDEDEDEDDEDEDGEGEDNENNASQEGIIDPSNDDSESEETKYPLEETVLQVFERMLDERSLQIIKNRGKGGAAAAAAAAAAEAAKNNTDAANATDATAGSVVSSQVPLPIVA